MWLFSKRSTKARGDAATMSGCKFYENMWMQCDDECNKQIKHTTITKNMEGDWSVGLGALQLGLEGV